MAKITLTWNEKAAARTLTAEVTKRLERGMTTACLFLHRYVVNSINTGQPVRRTKGGRLVGLDPSAPYEPPHVLHGRLKQSISWEVTKTPNAVIGQVGSNVEYARRLELGFHGRDAAGRNVNQLPRPYLRPALEHNRRRLKELILAG